jgi:hypothetical protein
MGEGGRKERREARRAGAGRRPTLASSPPDTRLPRTTSPAPSAFAPTARGASISLIVSTSVTVSASAIPSRLDNVSAGASNAPNTLPEMSAAEFSPHPHPHVASPFAPSKNTGTRRDTSPARRCCIISTLLPATSRFLSSNLSRSPCAAIVCSSPLRPNTDNATWPPRVPPTNSTLNQTPRQRHQHPLVVCSPPSR